MPDSSHERAHLPSRRPTASSGTPQTCTTVVRRGDDWHFTHEPCGKKAKGALKDGSPACGTHLRSERIAAEKADAMETFKKRIAAVNAALGLKAFGWEPDRGVRVSLEALERLAATIGDAGAPSVPSEGSGSK